VPVHQLLADGSVVEVHGPVVDAEDPGLLRGEAVFETLTCGVGGPVLLEEHLERMQRSATALELQLPPAVHLRTLAGTAGPGMVLRLVSTRGGTTFAVLTPMPEHGAARRDGISVVTLELGVPAGLRPAAPWLLGGAKCTSYAVAMAAQRAAVRAGADDALWVSSDGEVLEASTSNVAWVSGATLHTVDPALTGILDGTTLRWALSAAGLPTAVHRAPLSEVRRAQEVLLTSSVRGVVGVRRLDDISYGPPGPVTQALVASWAELTGLS
jgi:4-amino-4-deoxychorismate lyase